MFTSRTITLSIYLVLSCSFISYNCQAQKVTQTINGVVLDAQTQQPIAGVSVELLYFSPLKITKTNTEGKFIIVGIPTGKYKLLFQKKGYEDAVYENLIVGSVENTSIIQSLRFKKKKKNRPTPTNPVVPFPWGTDEKVTSFSQPEDKITATNHLIVSSNENYLAIGNRNDPLRFFSNYAGVQMLSDYSSLFLIRGNAPNTVEWQIEGLPVPSIIHNDRLQGNWKGKGSILSLYGIGASSLEMGALQAISGNSLYSTLNLNLRKTNTQRKLSFQAAYHTGSGLEFCIQGPISREKKGSFVINYSYSAFNPLQYALSEISNLPAITVHPQYIPNLQDASFRLDFPTPTYNQFSLFGLVSISHQYLYGYSPIIRPLHPIAQEDTNEYFRSNYAWGGLRYKKTWGSENENYWKSTLGASYWTINHLRDRLVSRFSTTSVFSQEDWQYSVHLNSIFYQEINPKLLFKGGLLFGHQVYDYYDLYYNTPAIRPVFSRNWTKSRQSLQANAQLQATPIPNLTFHAGLQFRTQLVELSHHYTLLLPKFALDWQIANKHQLRMGYAMQSQTLDMLLLIQQNQTQEWKANLDLAPTMSNNIDLTYLWNFHPTWRTSTQLYYQYQTNIWIDQTAPSISHWYLGSQFDSWQVLQGQHLIAGANQHKLGISFSIEKYFSTDFYGLFTFDFVNIASEVSNQNLRFENPQFGGAISSSLVIGKSFPIGPIRKNELRLEAKINYQQQPNQLAIDTLASSLARHIVYDYTQGFTQKIAPYFRADFRAAFHFRPRSNEEVEHQLSLEVLNITNHQNLAFPFYNRTDQQIEWQTQLPIFVELGYWVKF